MIKIFAILMLSTLISSSKVKLCVEVKNVQPGKGSVVADVFHGKNNFLKNHLLEKTVKADSSIINFIFKIPAGEYVVAAYQDLNNDKKLDKGIFSIPTEPYGFSNNYRPFMSAPKYKGCKFWLAGDTVITINLK